VTVRNFRGAPARRPRRASGPLIANGSFILDRPQANYHQIVKFFWRCAGRFLLQLAINLLWQKFLTTGAKMR
jgi:hypothetical protein